MSDLTIPQSLPLLEALCWNIADPYALSPQDMLSVYETNWQFLGILGSPNKNEIEFIKSISQLYKGLPLVEQIDKKELYSAITVIFNNLNYELLADCQVYLGGGTLVNLQHGQFRYSQDLDFLCNSDGFYRLRERIVNSQNNYIFQANEVIQVSNARIDRYAIRFPVRVILDNINQNEIAIKVEIVVEETLPIDAAIYPEGIKVPCLNAIDLVAAKLLANYDRWLDKSKYSRDLIDLAVIRTKGKLPESAFDKATAAYRLSNSIETSLIEAINWFQSLPEYREQCYRQLQIDNPVQIIDGIDLLATDFGLDLTDRTFSETDFSYLE